MRKTRRVQSLICLAGLALLVGVAFANSTTGWNKDITITNVDGQGTANVKIKDTAGTTHDYYVPDPSSLLTKLQAAAAKSDSCKVTVETNDSGQITAVDGCDKKLRAQPMQFPH